jgi:cation:H+ antiporter
MSSLPLAVLLADFVGAGAAVWVAGITLSDATDVLDTRLGLGGRSAG